MSATKLAAAGYPLVSVMPPDAPLSPNSKVDPSTRGKVPGKKGASGWYGYNFLVDKAPGAKTVEKWGANVGVVAANYPALDIDVDDDTVATAIASFAQAQLGEAPVRTSAGSRLLLPYRTDEPFARMGITFTYDGREQLVEVLGEGRQYLVYGTHPSGAAYAWRGPTLWETPREQLTRVTRAEVDAFLALLVERLRANGIDAERQGSGKTAADAPPQEKLRAPSLDALQKLLALMPNPAEWGWHQMVEMGYAVKAAGGEDARDAFLEWCSRWEGGHDPEQDERNWGTFKAPYRVGWNWIVEQAEMFNVIDRTLDEFGVVAEDVDAEWPERELETVGLSDMWVIRKILPALRSKMCNVPEIGGGATWYVWRGHLWQKDDVLGHHLVVHELLRRLAVSLAAAAREAEAKEESKKATALANTAKRIQSNAGINAILSMLRPYLAVRPTDFDLDTMALNTPGGLIDLATGAVRKTTPKDMVARSTRVAAKAGPAPRWIAFMNDLTGSDPELIRYFQKAMGYFLTGEVVEKIVQMLWGSDSNTGKSTLIRAVMGIMGNYADSVNVKTFIGKGEALPLARLPGARLVTATEPAAGQAWDEERIKAITGGDSIEVRAHYAMPFTYFPQFKIVVVGNHEPEIATLDDAMLQRIHLVPVNRAVPREKQVRGLSEILVREEGPQILHWMIEGCRLWQAEGLTQPPVVRTKTLEYAREEDMFGQWLEEECEMHFSFTAPSKVLYSAWSMWCRGHDVDPGNDKTFKRRFAARRLDGVHHGQIGPEHQRVRGFKGIRLRPRIEFTGGEE